jgi:hypothetical protein
MNATPNDFSLHALEARFEMQRFYENEIINPNDGGGGGDYGYYGNSWDTSGNGYVGDYQVASDNSGAMLDDGTFTDGASGAFPAFNNPDVCGLNPTFPGCPQPTAPQASRCTICRC